MNSFFNQLITNYKKMTNQEEQALEQKAEKLKQHIQYLECPKGGDHTGELLSLVCLDAACKKNDAILNCCICLDQDHQGHNVKPIKHLLHETDTFIQSSKDGKSTKKIQKVEIFEELKRQKLLVKEELASLRTTLNANITTLETSFENLFANLNTQVEYNQFTDTDLESILDHVYESQNDFHKLLAALKKIIDTLPSDLRLFDKKTDQAEVMNLLQSSGQDNKKSLQVLKDQLKANFTEIQAKLDKKMNIEIFNPKLEFTFSTQFKHANIQIVNPTTAKAVATGTGYKFAVLAPSLENTYGKKVTFGFKMKEVSASNWIAVGMCHVNTIVSKNYGFTFSQLGHGGYLISSNGGTWSTIKSQFNNLVKTFKYGKNDTIYVTYDPVELTLTFQKLKTNETYKLDFQVTSDPLHPCALFYYNNDEVEFLNPSQVNL